MRVAFALVLAGTVALSAQSETPTAPLAFEVASVKPNNTGSTASRSQSGRSRVTATNVPLRWLIAEAYGVRSNRLAGPGWIDTARFDINARAPDNTPDSQLDLMLRGLLIDRFKLVARAELREQPIYVLVLANSDGKMGSNIRPATDCGKTAFAGGPGAPGVARPPAVLTGPMQCGIQSSSNPTGTVMTGGAVRMSDLARTLDGRAERLVVDRTGLPGTFNFELRFAGPNLQTA